MTRGEYLAEKVKMVEKDVKNLQAYYKWLLSELLKEDEDLYDAYILTKEMRLKK